MAIVERRRIPSRPLPAQNFDVYPNAKPPAPAKPKPVATVAPLPVPPVSSTPVRKMADVHHQVISPPLAPKPQTSPAFVPRPNPRPDPPPRPSPSPPLPPAAKAPGSAPAARLLVDGQIVAVEGQVNAITRGGSGWWTVPNF